MALVLVAVSTIIAFASAPSAENAKTIEHFGIEYEPVNRPVEPRTKPGEWLEYSPLLTILVAAFCSGISSTSSALPAGSLAALDLNTYNLIFITVGLLLHWRPRSFIRAVSECIPATGGVLIQFPFYALIFGMIVGTGMSDWLADIFARVTTPVTYPLLVALYSAIIGVFVPSGGSKWVIEAPYVLQAAIITSAYGLGSANLQCLGGAAQPGESILDASAAGHSQAESARPRRIWRPAIVGPCPNRVLFMLVVRTISSVCAAGTLSSGFTEFKK